MTCGPPLAVLARLSRLFRWLPEDRRSAAAAALTALAAVTLTAMLLLTWLRHVGGNLADSTRYAANPVWMHRNVRAVLQGLGVGPGARGLEA